MSPEQKPESAGRGTQYGGRRKGEELVWCVCKSHKEAKEWREGMPNPDNWEIVRVEVTPV